MSQAHVNALRLARGRLEKNTNYALFYALPDGKAGEELRTAVLNSLEGEVSLYNWIRRAQGCGEWDDYGESAFNAKLLSTQLAWIDQMLIDWKDAP